MRALLQRAGYSLKADAKLSRPSEAKRKEYFNAILTEWEAFKKSGFHNFYSGGYEQAWKNYCQNVDEPVETLWEIAFYTPDGKAPGAGMWGTYIGPSTDQASIYGRANSFFVVLPTWASFYDENDIRLDVNIKLIIRVRKYIILSLTIRRNQLQVRIPLPINSIIRASGEENGLG